MNNAQKYSDMTEEEILEEFSEAICAICPWNDVDHHPLTLCEGSYCESALELFLDGDAE